VSELPFDHVETGPMASKGTYQRCTTRVRVHSAHLLCRGTWQHAPLRPRERRVTKAQKNLLPSSRGRFLRSGTANRHARVRFTVCPNSSKELRRYKREPFGTTGISQSSPLQASALCSLQSVTNG